MSALLCPRCGTGQDEGERFCPSCGVPLVLAGRAPVVTGARAVARRVKPQYCDGELVRVAGARHQAEAELIQGLLLEAGVPSTTRRTRGFDVPDFLAAGPRDVLVPESGVLAAHEALGTRPSDIVAGWSPPGAAIMLALLAGVIAAAVLVWLLA